MPVSMEEQTMKELLKQADSAHVTEGRFGYRTPLMNGRGNFFASMWDRR